MVMGKEPSAASDAIKEKKGLVPKRDGFLDDQPLKLPFKLPSFLKRKPGASRELTRDRGDRGFQRIVGIGVVGLLSTFLAVALDQPLYFLASLPAGAPLFHATRR